ncbi:ABC transporter permease [Pedobacter montanisoli]|uniref:ABC transporter permease n=1 Tax=Pedobacter montanisoli TaxID=2923277 RepID=A0ABS9ZX66_9SPHI|nr:ABC transporter permease [Pedobacter montanisoli]MCJ0742916.1 ABC transporter permease [Pedobacter montanisoli]
MFKLNLKIALRNLWKNKTYTIINILGLSIGMACCILIFMFINYQMSYDKGYKNEDQIYRVVSTWNYADGNNFSSQGVPLPLAPALRNDFSAQLEKVSAIQQAFGIVKINDAKGNEKLKTQERTFYIEPEFFDIFDFKWLAGQADELKNPNTTILTKETATRFFGDWKNAVGKSFNYQNNENYKVIGVIDDLPKNSSFPIRIVLSYKNYKNKNMDRWGSCSSSSECYVLLKKGVDINSLSAPMAQFVNKYYTDKGPGKEGHHFQALSQIHYDPEYGNFAGNTMPMKEIYGLMVIGAFLMLTACINFINLATAQSISRSKEIGVRKVMGSMRKQLIVQFLTETFSLTLIALLFACVLTEAALPGMRNLFNIDMAFNIFQYPSIFLFMVALTVVVACLSGFYPALVMSGFSPALAIKNKVKANTGGLGLRKVLVVVQFALTVVLIIGTLFIINQMKYIRERPIGFNPSAIALVDIPNDSISRTRFDVLKSRIMQVPGVKNLTLCMSAPSSSNNNESNFSYNSSKDADFQVNTKVGDENYFKTFGLDFVAGRAFSKSDTIREYVVNETLLKRLNVPNPQEAVGKKLNISGRSGQIVGVVKDFNNNSLRDGISPIAISTYKKGYYTMAVKLDSKQIMQGMADIQKIWNNVFPEYVYSSSFMDDEINSYYESEKIMGTLFKVFAGVIIFISFIGLFGLISFVAAQRTKEVAIRRVLGASTFELVKMLNGSFLLMVFIANLVAWPLAYVFVSKWLNGFTYRINVSIWPFVIAMCISLIITLITVSMRSLRAAKANAIDALKYE